MLSCTKEVLKIMLVILYRVDLYCRTMINANIFGFFRDTWVGFRDKRRQEIAIRDFQEEMLSVPIFLLLILLAGCIASVGLLRSNQSVLIGAMLITPLVSPFVGIPLSIFTRTPELFWASLIRIFSGVGVFWSVAFLIGKIFLPSSIANNFEFIKVLPIALPEVLIAIFGGLVAGIALSSEKIQNLISGAAIALALAPPLAVSGIGLAFGDFAIFRSAFTLFAVNALGLILMGGIIFWLFGFRKPESENQLV
jgi:uncharacterized hydrophobic protein (TIGR00271 family)